MSVSEEFHERFGTRRRRDFIRALLRWYVASHRRLPWRSEPGELGEFYHVLVSESMLQQTQVATVIDYFDRFMKSFPTLDALAEADEQEVLRLWQGLGYYRRARHLHAAARRICDSGGEEGLGGMDGIRDLPGVGRYTAGAIGSIAFGMAEPVVDGNVARVVSRLMNCDDPVDDAGVLGEIWDVVGCLVEDVEHADGRYRAGDFNQAVMELGALVCSPRKPRCGDCPVRRYCAGFEAGRQVELPVKRGRVKQKVVTHQVVALKRGGRYLFQQRPEKGLWSKLWQLPTIEGGGDVETFAREQFDLNVECVAKVNSFEHLTTHRRIRFELYEAKVRARGKVGGGKGIYWRELCDIEDLPLSNPQRKAVDILISGSEGRGEKV